MQWCFHADVYDNLGNIIVEEKCPFCRTPSPATDNEIIERIKKRMEVGDALAFLLMGNYYSSGQYGLPQGRSKAKLPLIIFNNGKGVERDEKKAEYYLELAAMEGNVVARFNLGVSEENAGNCDRALKHFMIAVRGGSY